MRRALKELLWDEAGQFILRRPVGVQSPPPPPGAHPSIWLSPSVLANVTAKKVASDADWLSIKSTADFFANSVTPPKYTITGATNAKPVEYTLLENVPWTPVPPATEAVEDVYIAGATGAWSPANAINYPPFIGRKTGTHTFSAWGNGINFHFISNTNPVQVALWQNVSWTGSDTVFIYGLSGTWAALNGQRVATKTTFGSSSVVGSFPSGSTSITVADGTQFSPLGGIVLYSGFVIVRYTGVSGNTLTGIPPSGDGSIGSTLTNGTVLSSPPVTFTLPIDTTTFGTFDYSTMGGTVATALDSTGFGPFAGQDVAVFPYNSVGFSYQGQGWFDTMVALALCYQILGNSPTPYGTRCLQWLDFIVRLGVKGMRQPVSVDSFWATRFTLPAMAIAYDWCYPLLTGQQKADFASCINFWFDEAVASAIDWNGPLASNYYTGHMWGVGSIGLASAGDNARSAEIVNTVRTQINNVAVAGFASGDYAGGYPYEAYGYGTNSYERLLYYFDALTTATGENLAINSSSQLADNIIYALRPDRWRVGDEGDYPGGYVGVLITSYPIVLAHVLAGTARGGWMQRVYNNRAIVAGQDTPTLTRLLWYNSTTPSVDYTATEPTARYSAGDGRLYRRSDWTDNAVWMQMSGGTIHIADHQAKTAGHIEIQRGADYLMPYAGQYKGTDGVSGLPDVFQLSAQYANTLSHADGGVYVFTGEAYAGGQGVWGTNNILAHEANSALGFGYLSSDLTSAYYTNDLPPHSGRTLTSYRRAAVFTGTGVGVVFDRAIRTSSTYTEKLLWHFNTGATIGVASGIVSVALGSSKLFMKPLLPATSTITQTRDTPSPSSATPTTYRIEVTDSGAPSTTLTGLHAFYVGSSGLGAMPATSLITSSGSTMFGCSIVDGSTTYVVMFSADGTAQDTVSYTA